MKYVNSILEGDKNYEGKNRGKGGKGYCFPF